MLIHAQMEAELAVIELKRVKPAQSVDRSGDGAKRGSQ